MGRDGTERDGTGRDETGRVGRTTGTGKSEGNHATRTQHQWTLRAASCAGTAVLTTHQTTWAAAIEREGRDGGP